MVPSLAESMRIHSSSRAVASRLALFATSLGLGLAPLAAQTGPIGQGEKKPPVRKVPDLQKPAGQRAGRGKVLGLPAPARDKSDRAGALVIGKRRTAKQAKKAPVTAPKDGDLAMAGFIEALGDKTKTFADAELVAEYSLLTPDERSSLIARAHRLSNLAVTRLARVWRALPERKAAPALVTILKSRKLGKHTAPIVDHLFFLLGPEAKLVALDCLTSPHKVLRTIATERLSLLLTREDLPRLRSFLRHKDQGVRISSLQALARWLVEHPQEDLAPLAACLRHADGAVRAQAASLLAAQGSRAVESVLPFVAADPTGPEWFLAALLLTRRELASSEPILPAPALRRLGRSRYDARVLSRTTAAIVAGLRLYDDPASLRDKSSGFADLSREEILDALIEVTDVSTYYPELGFCHDAALLALRLLTGEDFSADHRRWATWWRGVRKTFVPFTRAVELDEANATKGRLTVFEGSTVVAVLMGADAPEPPARDGGFRARLADAELLALMGKLQARGLFDLEQRLLESKGIVEGRAIEFEVGDVRARDGFPRGESLRFRTFERVLADTMESESWQQYCPDDLAGMERRDWWREQRLQFAKAADEAGRRAHEIELALRVLDQLDAQWRTHAIDRFLAESKRDDSQLGQRASDALLTFLSSARERNRTADSLRITEDERQKLFETLARTKIAETGKILDALAISPSPELRASLVRVLAVRGEEAVLAALKHDSHVLRATAASEASRFSTPRITASLIACLRDSDWDVRRRAVESLGTLKVTEASDEIHRLVEDAEALVRHASLLALGRLGGKLAFERLLRATGPGLPGDRLAAVRGLASLEEPRAASSLVGIAAAHMGQPLGMQAIQGLEERSSPSLRAEVRRWLESSDDPILRQRFTFLLGEMGDPAVAANLLRLVERGESGARACILLAQLSGLDYCARRDRVALYRKWVEELADEPVPIRLLNALGESKIEHGLTDAMENVTQPTAVVDELARLIIETKDPQWPIRTLAAQMLREVTGQDYGTVRRSTRLGVRRALVERYRQFVLAKSGR